MFKALINTLKFMLYLFIFILFFYLLQVKD